MEKGNCDRTPKALILDCGGVLAYPTHGDWTFPPAMMESLRAFPARDVVIARARAALEQLLRGERHKNSETRRGQASLYFYSVHSQRQAAHQALLLLEVQ